MRTFNELKNAVAGIVYVGLSITPLLAQYHLVTAVDVNPEKVDKINKQIPPILDEYIEKSFAEKELSLTASLSNAAAYNEADYIQVNIYARNF